MHKPMLILVGAVSIMALLGTAMSSSNDRPAGETREQLEALVKREVYRVFPASRSDFQLSREDKGAFAFYGRRLDEFVPVECARTAFFSILAKANLKGHLGVGVCDGQGKRLQKLMENVPLGIRNTFKAIQGKENRLSDEEMARGGWVYERTMLEDQSELHYFPLLMLGHGVMAGPTVVVIKDNRAFVIQAGITNLCADDDSNMKLCTNTKSGLQELARRLHADLWKPEM